MAIMYHGKFDKPVTHGKRKKIVALLISLVLLLCAVVGGSIAFLMDYTEKVENTFTPARVTIEVKEDFNENVKKNVYVENTSEVSVYIRVKLVENWKIGEQIVPEPTGDNAAKAVRKIEWGQNSDWFVQNGIYYYKKMVPAGEETTNLIDTVTVTLDGYTYHLNILAEAIQANPEGAVEAAWTDVTVENGQLAPKQEVQG